MYALVYSVQYCNYSVVYLKGAEWHERRDSDIARVAIVDAEHKEDSDGGEQRRQELSSEE